MSSQIEGERKDDYSELESASRGDVDITSWLTWFLKCLGRALDGADVTLAAVLHKARIWQRISRHPINARQRIVVNRLLNGLEGARTKSKYAVLAKCSAVTALRDIQEFVEHGVLVRNASGGRSTSYRISDELGSLDRR